MRTLFAIFITGFLFLYGCKTREQPASDYLNEAVELNAIEVFSNQPYRATRTREMDILHTDLDVWFDWEKQYLYGTAIITAKPYFYTTNVFVLNAKGMDISKVELLSGSLSKPLEYTYQNDVLSISLDRNYSRWEQIQIRIEYVAKPEERETTAGNAVTSDKGLYFINPLGTNPNKPQQLWTQGETEANSVWFPTIDSPNERCTHEISITVDNKFVTLSNGDLVSSVQNDDGTRTDTWSQNKPIAPYLFMMAVSDFGVVTDSLNGMIVDYYVDKGYEPYAREIFKNTPEMISFFSELLQYDYPWSKYSQVIVHDYVSGAMENVGAVIFGDFVQQTHREMIDGDNEEIVAHELFHHWFGDLVTCESWSNLPLNESFATYGEYLWIEHKYGKMAADEHLQMDLENYLYEVQSAGAQNLIRFYYNQPDDMFDSHSYAKGGRILHMLRNYVGDEAFFASLNLYLKENEYQSVEIHNLRLAFEKITGEDLNWFFNQWFMGKGHPELDLTYTYDTNALVQHIAVAQTQDVADYGLFRFPVDIDIYIDGKPHTYSVMIDSAEQTFSFKVDKQPDFVNFDAKKILVCTKTENHTMEEMANMYYMAPLYVDKLEAVNFAFADSTNPGLAKKVLLDAMGDDYHGIRQIAVGYFEKFDPIEDLQLVDVLRTTVQNDPESSVRAEAVVALYSAYAWEDGMNALFVSQIEKDSSYMVQSELLRAIAISDSTTGLVYAGRFENSENMSVLFSVAEIYSVFGNEEHNDFFKKLYPKVEGYYIISFVDFYKDFLLGIDNISIHQEALDIYEKEAKSELAWFIRYYAVNGMAELQMAYDSRAANAKKADNTKKAEEYENLSKRIDAFLIQLQAEEKDQRVFMNR